MGGHHIKLINKTKLQSLVCKLPFASMRNYILREFIKNTRAIDYIENKFSVEKKSQKFNGYHYRKKIPKNDPTPTPTPTPTIYLYFSF